MMEAVPFTFDGIDPIIGSEDRVSTRRAPEPRKINPENKYQKRWCTSDSIDLEWRG